MQKKKITKLFFAWQDEKEQVWLEQMAAHGWVLDEVGLIRYTFCKQEPQQIRYRLDYQEIKGNDLLEYLSLFTDAGWEYKGRMNNWFYFAAKDPETGEIYTDTQSKIEKYKRVLRTLLIACFPVTYSLFSFSRLSEGAESSALNGVMWVFQCMIFLIAVALVLNTIRLWVKIQKMEKKI